MTFAHRVAHDTAATIEQVVAAAAVAYGVVGAPRLLSLLSRDVRRRHQRSDPP